MITFLNEWCENIIIGVIIVIIIEMITPKRNLKYINIVSGFFVLYLIISPITVLGEEKDIDYFFGKIKEETENMINDSKINTVDSLGFNNINDVLLEGIKIDIKNALEDEKIYVDDVEILFSNNNDKVEKIIVKLKNIKDLENEEKIKKVIKNKLDIDNNIIYIN